MERPRTPLRGVPAGAETPHGRGDPRPVFDHLAKPLLPYSGSFAKSLRKWSVSSAEFLLLAILAA